MENNCPQCMTLLTDKSKEYVEEYQKETNGFLFAQLIKDIKSLEITEFEEMILLRQINLLRFNCRSKISHTTEVAKFIAYEE